MHPRGGDRSGVRRAHPGSRQGGRLLHARAPLGVRRKAIAGPRGLGRGDRASRGSRLDPHRRTAWRAGRSRRLRQGCRWRLARASTPRGAHGSKRSPAPPSILFSVPGAPRLPMRTGVSSRAVLPPTRPGWRANQVSSWARSEQSGCASLRRAMRAKRSLSSSRKTLLLKRSAIRSRRSRRPFGFAETSFTLAQLRQFRRFLRQEERHLPNRNALHRWSQLRLVPSGPRRGQARGARGVGQGLPRLLRVRPEERRREARHRRGGHRGWGGQPDGRPQWRFFYDRSGDDWDATVTKIVENPTSVRSAFWSPYKRVVRAIEQHVTKRASAADSEAGQGLEEHATAATSTDTEKPAASVAAPKKIDVGTVAAIGVAVGGIAAFFSSIVATFLGLGIWMPLGALRSCSRFRAPRCSSHGSSSLSATSADPRCERVGGERVRTHQRPLWRRAHHARRAAQRELAAFWTIRSP